VKKTVMAAGIFLALGVVCYVSQLWGQAQTQPSSPPAATAPPAKTRIAILNLTYVISNYEKYKRFKEESKSIVEPFETRHKDLTGQLENLKKRAADSARQPQPVDREALEKQAKDIQRQLEDINIEAKMKVGKRLEDEARIIFSDVYEAAQRYAVSHDFELVLHYNDAINKEDFFSPQNINRKLNTGALMPLYWLPSMDISMDVVNLLNAGAGAGGGAAPPAGAPQR
jgi:Skp family chaperone for outer membrane proteins